VCYVTVSRQGLPAEPFPPRRAYPSARSGGGALQNRARITSRDDARPAVFLGDVDPKQAGLPHLLRPPVWELLALVEGMGLGDDVLRREIADRLARDFLRLRESEVHVGRQKSSCRIKSPRAEP